MNYDVAVVGGGIAGGSAAIRLARLGYAVLVLEKEREATHKICGEFLSGECQPLLREMGLDLDMLQATEIRTLVLAVEQTEMQMGLPFVGRGISRKILDEGLLSLAAQHGADVRRGVMVKGFKQRSNGTEIETSEGPNSAKNIFWAIGKTEMRSVLQRRGIDENFVGFKRHLRLPRDLAESVRGRVELHLFRGGYAGLSEIEDEFFNFCFIMNKRQVKSLGQNWRKITDHQSLKNIRLMEVFAGAQWEWPRPLTIGHIPYGYVYENTLPEYFVIGDQFAVIPSLTGDGMAMSLYSAKEAVKAFHRAKETGQEMQKSIAQYNRDIKSTFSRPVRWGNYLQRIFQSPRVAKLLIRAIRPFPGITKRLIEQTRCLNLA